LHVKIVAEADATLETCTNTAKASEITCIAAAGTNMRRCPNQYFCPPGTMVEYSIPGNFTTPQICKDGIVCGQNVHMSEVVDQPGALT
jgi:hypothetical protein